MGYSVPKKPLDLKEFLSEPAKVSARRQFGYRHSKPAVTKAAPGDEAPKPSAGNEEKQG
ncbi:hypothetical protein [Pararhodobacter marinus]|uniref:hypothetical protein n=1 Tax=Pararhodobacter marinus TaxID=2184063 RepID=UPI00143D29A5|nr:hypothetical protein [Pararhodobacter marinus]